MPYGLLRFVIDFLVRSRLAAGIFCGTGVVVFGFFGVRCMNELRKYPEQPASVLSKDVASARGWINVTDARLDCSHALRRSGSNLTPLLGTGPSDVLVELKVPCDGAPHAVSGVIEPTAPSVARYLESNGVRLHPGADLYELSTISGPSNERTGVLVCSIMFLACGGLYPLLGYSRRRRFPALGE
jgi:hypothetical protein